MKKRLRIRSLILQLLFAMLPCSVAFAADDADQELLQQKVSLDIKEAPIEKVLRQIEKMADVKFLYSSSLVRTDRKVNVVVNNESLGKVLDQLLLPMQLQYQVSGRQIILNRLRSQVTSSEDQQQVRISGKVTDDRNVLLPGVSVKLKGTTLGATTDGNGNFAFNIPEYKGILVFSYIGFASRELEITGGNAITMKLEPSSTSLNDVVVVGYGMQKKESLTGAIASVSSKDLGSVHAGSTVSATLAGKIPGVTFRFSDGRPGASASVQIRNMGDPLYVIDGIQQDAGQFNNIAPSDIESVTVLKDASAAIYGLRAANGVVVVTTKRGKLGSRNTININMYKGWQNWTRFPKTVNAYEWMLGKADAEVNASGKTNITPEEISKWKEGGPGYKSFDWYNFIIKPNAPLTQMNLNFSGGSDRINYYVSATHLKQYAVLGREFTFERTNIQSNIEARVSDQFKIGAQINGRVETRDQPGVPGGDDYLAARFAILRNTPIERAYANDNPDYPNDIGHNTENWAVQNKKLSGYWRSDWRVLQTNLTAEYQFPLEGLTAKGLFSYYYANELMNGHEYTYQVYTYNQTDSTYKVTGGSSNPYRERRNVTILSPTLQGQLNYNKTFGLHTVGATFVAERIKRRNVTNYLHSVPSTNQLPLIYFSTMDTYNDYDSTVARLGYIGRLNYSYGGKYYIEVSARRDASWKFSPDKRWGTFPAISGGWRVTEEKFIRSVVSSKILSELKLRASYGKLGDDAVGIAMYDYLAGYNYNSSTVILDGVPVIGSSNKGVPVKNISWFVSKTFDVGADYGFLENKITGTVDYFKRRRTGLLGTKYDILVPSELGYALPPENVRSDQVSGMEFSVAYTGKMNEVRYSAGGNFSYARAKSMRTYKPVFNNSQDHYRNSGEDRFSNVFWGYLVSGQFQSQEQINDYPVNVDGEGNKTLLPGDLIYKDIDKDGIINDRDMRPIGYGTGRNPIINFGINLSASWRGFDVRADFSGGAGYSFNRNAEMKVPYLSGGNLQSVFYDRWHRENAFDPDSKWIPGKYPALRFNNSSHSNYNKDSDFWLVNVKYLRARTLELGYTVPKEILSRAKIERARVYVNGYNLFSIDNTHAMGIDAEIVDDNGLTYPQSKFVNVGFELSF